MRHVLDSNDPKLLKEALRVLMASHEQCVKRIQLLTERVVALEGRELSQADLDFLNTLDLAPQPEAPAPSPPPPPERPSSAAPRRGHGPRKQLALPCEVQRHELPPDQRTCNVCSGELEEMGDQTEDSKEITVVQGTYKIVLHQRQKYRCCCNANIVTAPGPPKLIPGGRYDIAFAAAVATDKFGDHIPLERQAERMAREGLEVTSSTLCDQLDALATLCEPTWQAIGDAVLAQGVIHADETGWRMWKRGQKKRHPWTVWSLSTPDLAYYSIVDSKSEEEARQLFRDYRGIVVADGYRVYQNLSRAGGMHPPGDRDGPGFRLAHCWAHALRKFRDIELQEPGRCRDVLTLIGDLYEVERKVDGPFPGSAEAQMQRLAIRQKESRLIIDEILKWAHAQGGLRQSDFGRATRYMLARWSGLTLFLNEPCVALDNNHAERRVRRPVIGRKNHFGSRSPRGTQVAACFYSLVETARLWGIQPAAYLRDIGQAAAKQPGVVLLPSSYSSNNR